ncbi:MAG TPA: hypothetical protein DCE33_06080 [Rhodospirillaceae bacterium]|nr:hypothetical protein [Rhodospirillaceae bacterium]
MTNELKLLSAGACRNAVLKTTEAFTAEHDIPIDITFVTAPAMRETIAASDHGFQALVGAEAVVNSFLDAGSLQPDPFERLGAIASSVVVRDGTPHPDISTVETFCESIRNASAVIYNVASSGIYIEKLLDDLGLAKDIAERTERTPTGAAVMDRIGAGTAANEIGFGQMTEILRVNGTGVKVDLVGPLPDAIANMTIFFAGVVAGAENNATATAFVEFLAGDTAKALIREAGLS